MQQKVEVESLSIYSFVVSSSSVSVSFVSFTVALVLTFTFALVVTSTCFFSYLPQANLVECFAYADWPFLRQ
jgi:hypothetical protein